jgi:hypothetical protein
LAFNSKGEAVVLPEDSEVALTAETEKTAPQAGLFNDCELPPSNTLLTGTGVFVLTIAPTSEYQGRAQVSGLGESVLTGFACGSGFKVEGVKFRLVAMNLTSTTNGLNPATFAKLVNLSTKTDKESLALMRNLLAHLCFGTEERKNFARNPLPQLSGNILYTRTALDNLTDLIQISDCEVPLALLYWTATGVQFVDMGAVRRRPASASPASAYPFSLGYGYPALGEAISLQFQEQLTKLTANEVPQNEIQTLEAKKHFRYLPAAGIIPHRFINQSNRGLEYKTFFKNVTYREPVFIEGAVLDELFLNSLSFPPVDLENGETLWLYFVRENRQALDNKVSGTQGYLIFSSGFVPFRGHARFNLSKWDYSNYTPLSI